MRLTVHVENAQQEKVEVKPNVMKSILKNTFSFSDVSESDVNGILKGLESEGLNPTKHYLSGQKILGRASGKKK